MLKSSVKKILKLFGKRISNYHSPAKPFVNGVEYIKTVLSSPDFIIDIGVADGTPEITRVFPYSEYKHILVEANQKFISELNLIAEKYPKNVIVEHCFCSDNKGSVQLFVDESGRKSSKQQFGSQASSLNIETKLLDDITLKHNLKGQGLLKIDVEGAELDVLNGASETLKICKVVIVECWMNSDQVRNFENVVSLMDKKGFKVFDFFGGHCDSEGELKIIDVVFISRDYK